MRNQNCCKQSASLILSNLFVCLALKMLLQKPGYLQLCMFSVENADISG